MLILLEKCIISLSFCTVSSSSQLYGRWNTFLICWIFSCKNAKTTIFCLVLRFYASVPKSIEKPIFEHSVVNESDMTSEIKRM